MAWLKERVFYILITSCSRQLAHKGNLMYRIILDCDLMRYPDSGLYHYCLNLGLNMKRLLEKESDGHISFYVPGAEKQAFGKDASCIVERKWHRGFLRPYVLDCHIWHAPFQSGRVVPGNSKKSRVLLTIHDLNCLHEGKSEREKRHSLNKTQRLIDQSHAIVCISEHSYRDVMNNLDTGSKLVHVIHNGTHQVGIPGETPADYQPQRPFLFTMGYVNRKKNFHTLVSLLDDAGYELVIAGKIDEPDYARKIKRIAAEAGVESRLHILGPVSEDDKAWYLKNCSAFLLPSLAEGFGAPVVEAMQFGKPVFLSALTSLPEIGSDAAFYFTDFEKENMRKAFHRGMQQYNANGMALKIIQRSRDFRWEDKAKQYLEVYRSMLA